MYHSYKRFDQQNWREVKFLKILCVIRKKDLILINNWRQVKFHIISYNSDTK